MGMSISTREQRKQLLSSYTHKLSQQFSPKGIIIRPTSWCQVSMHQEICMPLYTCTCTVVGGVNWVQVTQKSICQTGQEYSYYTSLNSVHHILQLWPGLPDGLHEGTLEWENNQPNPLGGDGSAGQWELLIGALHIQIHWLSYSSSEMHGGLKIPGCWTITVTKRNEGALLTLDFSWHVAIIIVVVSIALNSWCSHFLIGSLCAHSLL